MSKRTRYSAQFKAKEAIKGEETLVIPPENGGV
jgi:hypothetical protein